MPDMQYLLIVQGHQQPERVRLWLPALRGAAAGRGVRRVCDDGGPAGRRDHALLAPGAGAPAEGAPRSRPRGSQAGAPLPEGAAFSTQLYPCSFSPQALERLQKELRELDLKAAKQVLTEARSHCSIQTPPSFQSSASWPVPVAEEHCSMTALGQAFLEI